MIHVSACSPFRFVSLLCIVALGSACIPDYVEEKPPAKIVKPKTPTDGDSIASNWPDPDWAKIPQPTWQRTKVTRIAPIIRSIYPVTVNIVIEGLLNAPCEQIEEVQTQARDDLYQIAVFSTIPNQTCQNTNQAFEIIVPLITDNNPAGFYQVEVNGKITWFELMVDNNL